jgi:hypothetical protein
MSPTTAKSFARRASPSPLEQEVPEDVEGTTFDVVAEGWTRWPTARALSPSEP